MNIIFTVLFAFAIGYFVRQRGLAVVTYLAADAILFTYQTVNVLHDSWLDHDGRVDVTNRTLAGYGVVNIVVIAVGVALVVLGTVVAQRRAGKRNAVSVS